MSIRFLAMPTRTARALQAGMADAYGMTPERHVSAGAGVPCRHCLKTVPAGMSYLVLAYRPFPAMQPYAETGPVFLCQDSCERAAEGGDIPAMMRETPDFILRGYGEDDRIIYGTGCVVATAAIPERAAKLLERADVAYLHIRSARNNCYQCRVERE